VQAWSADQLRERVGEAMAVYAEAMGYPEVGSDRTAYVLTHTRRPGFRCRVVLDGHDDVVGFTYGYPSAPGQWWHDQVRRGLPDPAARRWLGDGFELCELHVRPAEQGRGRGRALLTTLVQDLPQSTVLLSTPEGESRAWRLYRSLGFSDLLRGYRFPGDPRDFAVLGRDLPLSVAAAARA